MPFCLMEIFDFISELTEAEMDCLAHRIVQDAFKEQTRDMNGVSTQRFLVVYSIKRW